MNDEASSSSAAAHDTSSYDGGLPTVEVAPTAAELAERSKKNRKMFNRKRAEHLDDLIRNLDILVYAQFSAIYYMDCSFPRLLLRTVPQFLLLTPKPPPFPPYPQHKPILPGLLITFLICFVCHIYFSPPTASEVTRGYLHGGLAMDFIGQKATGSRLALVGLDLLVLGLQVVLMGLVLVRRKLDGGEGKDGTVQAAEEVRQDHDAEERGVSRGEEQEDIEMRNLAPADSDHANESSDPLLSNTTAGGEEPDAIDPPTSTSGMPSEPTPRSDSRIFDAFHSGQVIIADLDIWKRVVEQSHLWRESRNTVSSSSGSGSRTFRGELAGTVLRLRMGTDRLRAAI